MDVIEQTNIDDIYDPVMDVAISSAILKQVSAGDLKETIRLFKPRRTLAFAPRDIRDPNYEKAVNLAISYGFQPVKRLTGGRAAVFHEGTLGFAWTIPDENPRLNVELRFKVISDLIKRSLCNLGFDARVGEVEGEYCSGKYSVNLNGNLKVMGVGQKLAPHACHIGGVIVVNDSHLTKSILVAIYQELRIDWEPKTAGSLDDINGNIHIDDVQNSILQCIKSTNKLSYRKLSKKTIGLAKQLLKHHK